MTGSVRYALPGGPFGDVAHAMIGRRRLNEIFNCRAEAISRMLERLHASGQEAIPTR
jgi:hypothetical protein